MQILHFVSNGIVCGRGKTMNQSKNQVAKKKMELNDTAHRSWSIPACQSKSLQPSTTGRPFEKTIKRFKKSERLILYMLYILTMCKVCWLKQNLAEMNLEKKWKILEICKRPSFRRRDAAPQLAWLAHHQENVTRQWYQRSSELEKNSPVGESWLSL